MFSKRLFEIYLRLIKRNYLSVNNLIEVYEKNAIDEELYGLMMIKGDLDILKEVIKYNFPYLNGVFVLDGSKNWKESRSILESSGKVECYIRDSDLPKSYRSPLRDGVRQVLLEKIQEKVGHRGYIIILHSDEIYYDMNPKLLIASMKKYQVDAIIIRAVHFFLHSSCKDSYQYNKDISVIKQVKYACFPGYKEFRIFKNRADIYYKIDQHSRVIPLGLRTWALTDFPVRHYLYRSIEQMKNSSFDRSKRSWQSYGYEWMKREDYFVDCLPGYKFTRYIPENKIILNGKTGKFLN